MSACSDTCFNRRNKILALAILNQRFSRFRPQVRHNLDVEREMIVLGRRRHEINVLDIHQYVGRFDVVQEPPEIFIAAAHRALQDALAGIGNRRRFGLI